METIRLRYNHQSGDNASKKWRLSIGEIELLVYKVLFFRCIVETTEEKVIINDEEILKYHVSCYAYENIKFLPTQNGWEVVISGYE